MTKLLLIGLIAAFAVAIALFGVAAFSRTDQPGRVLRAAFVATAVAMSFTAFYLYVVV